ncbi:MAG: hypothetical protein IPN90_04230 [Elusimicrobia bacterium]|nr:hypothetical protein [Elusimicrobiota bacterium]
MADLSLLGLLKEIEGLTPILAQRAWLGYVAVTALAETFARSTTANKAYWLSQIYSGRVEKSLVAEALRQSETSVVMVAGTDLFSKGVLDAQAVQTLVDLAASRASDTDLSSLRILVVDNGLSSATY